MNIWTTLYMYVCIYAYIYLYAHTHTHTHIYTHTYSRITVLYACNSHHVVNFNKKTRQKIFFKFFPSSLPGKRSLSFKSYRFKSRLRQEEGQPLSIFPLEVNSTFSNHLAKSLMILTAFWIAFWAKCPPRNMTTKEVKP